MLSKSQVAELRKHAEECRESICMKEHNLEILDTLDTLYVENESLHKAVSFTQDHNRKLLKVAEAAKEVEKHLLGDCKCEPPIGRCFKAMRVDSGLCETLFSLAALESSQRSEGEKK